MFFQTIMTIGCILVGAASFSYGSERVLGNGSSGVGNGKELDPNYSFSLPEGTIDIIPQGDKKIVIDPSTGEKLLRVSPISKAELASFQDRLVSARLGSVRGYEYLPSYQKTLSKYRHNFWIICPDSQNCLILEPLSISNPKVMSAVGSLVQVK